jgi:DNA processing protein
MPSPDAYWIALRAVRGVGPKSARILIEKFGAPDNIFGRTPSEIASAGIPRKTADAIAATANFDEAEKAVCEMQRIEARLVRITDPDFPPNLKHIADPPPFLYVRGNADLSNPNCIAVVGARAASDAGLRMAERLGFELAARGFAVISGLARGIDGAAHQGALAARGCTIAVMGSGIDMIYPPEHRPLAARMIESSGAIVSELPIGTPPIAENFPTRNRILSGLCMGVVIVEAAEHSGSLITARMALEQDRQIFAVPGSPLTGKSRGSNRLLKEGARLVECVEDVIEDLLPQMRSPISAASPRLSVGAGKPLKNMDFSKSAAPVAEDVGLTDGAKSVLDRLKATDRLHIDSIIDSCQLSVSAALEILLDLELRGRVTQHPGKLFSIA